MIKGTKIRLIAPYQHDGVRWMLAREKDPKISGGFLCDEMGLGKTVQTIATMHLNPKPKTLIVVPKSIVSQWSQEISRFAPESWKVCAYDGPKRSLVTDFNVCICPYSVLHDEELQIIKWDRVILDEAHEIRNPRSKIFSECMAFRSTIKWVLTGTPVFNSIKDFKTLCSFIGIAGGDVNRYHDQIRDTYVIRRTKADLRVKMVKCEFQNVELTMSEPEKILYSMVYEEFTDTIRYGANMMAILEGLLRCRQICVWPQLYYNGIAKKEDLDEPEQWQGLTVKLEYLMKSLADHPTEKSLIFTQFTGEANKIQELLSPTHQIFRLDGRTDTDKRQSIIDGFKNTSNRGAVFIIQIKTGGVGLNLQCASRVYITHPAWNPATELQAIARAHRGGQTNVVHVKKLVYIGEDSVENEIVELQNAKSIVCAQVLNDPRLLQQVPKIENVSKFIFRIGKKLRTDDN